MPMLEDLAIVLSVWVGTYVVLFACSRDARAVLPDLKEALFFWR